MSYIGLAAAVFGADWLFKERAEYKYPPESYPRYFLGDKIRFYRNHNPGFSMGVLEENRDFVTRTALIMTSATAGAFARALTDRESTGAEKAGLALMTGGAASNLYDRVKRGYVVDYLNFNVKGLDKIVWNLGDLALMAGGGLLSLQAAKDQMKKPPAGEAPAAEIKPVIAAERKAAKAAKVKMAKVKPAKEKAGKGKKKKNLYLTGAMLLWRWHKKRSAG